MDIKVRFEKNRFSSRCNFVEIGFPHHEKNVEKPVEKPVAIFFCKPKML